MAHRTSFTAPVLLAATLALGPIADASADVAPPASQIKAAAKTLAHRIDPRIRHVTFAPDAVVRVDTRLRHITALEFAPGEIVTAMLAGDGEGFEIVRLKNGRIVSVKPRAYGARTNLNVYTNRRSYVFDLRTRGSRTATPARIVFSYPQDEARAADETAARYHPGVDGPGPFGADDYAAAGDAGFRPVAMWDDGVNTFMRFPPQSRRPALFKVDATGQETAVNTSQITEDLVQIAGRSPRWTLRIGDELVCVVKGADAEAAEALEARIGAKRRPSPVPAAPQDGVEATNEI